MEQIPQNVPSVYSETKRILKCLQTGGYEMKFKRGVRRMTILKFLLGRLVHGGGLDVASYLALYDLWDWAVTRKDENFYKVYKEKLSKTKFIINKIGSQPTEFPFNLKIKEEEIEGTLVPTPSAYFGQEKQRYLSRSFKLILFSDLNPQRLKPKRYVGCGYTDEGTLRNFAQDGSPHWKEVSVDWKNRGLFPESEDLFDPLH